MTSNRFDEFERKFGISAYASPHEGFAAVVKARYSDFVVHEVDSKGNIARLESLEMPSPPKDSKADAASSEAKNDTSESVGAACEGSRKRKLSDSAQEPTPKAEDTNGWESRKEDLAKLIGETPAEEVISFLQGCDTDTNQPTDDNVKKFHMLPVIDDKQVRRSIHQLIKSPAFLSVARADNADGKIRIWSARFQADMPKDTFSGFVAGGKNNNNSKRGCRDGKGGNRGAPWPKDRPDFLRFVLYKENLDTTTGKIAVAVVQHITQSTLVIAD